MQKYRSRSTGAIFYAATPTEADAEFCLEADKYGLTLAEVTEFDAETKIMDFPKKVFMANSQIAVNQNEFLLLPTNPEIRIMYGPKTYSVTTGLYDFEEVMDNSTNKPQEPSIVNTLKGKSFYLDAGHGGKDPGAVNDNFGLQEKIAALDIILILGELLQAQGANIYYSRTDNDTYPALTQRATEANNYNVNAFISVHLNSAANKSASGIETLVYKNSGTAYELAKIVQTNMVAATNWKNRGVKTRPDLTVLAKTKMPAILCEVGFISNDDQASELFKPETQRKIANAIADGVIEMFK